MYIILLLLLNNWSKYYFKHSHIQQLLIKQLIQLQCLSIG